MSNPPKNRPPPKRHYGRPRRAELQPSVSPAEVADWIALGTIVAPFGIKGEVKLQPQTDFPERIGAHRTLYLGPDHTPYRLRHARPHGNQLVLQLDGVADMNAAERLRGQAVAIPLAEAAPLAADQYYIHDLIGLRAQHANGQLLGTVADVYTGAAQDLLVVRRPGQPDVLVPLVKAIVTDVDIPNGTVRINPPAGLFDENFEEA